MAVAERAQVHPGDVERHIVESHQGNPAPDHDPDQDLGLILVLEADHEADPEQEADHEADRDLILVVIVVLLTNDVLITVVTNQDQKVVQDQEQDPNHMEELFECMFPASINH